MDTATRLLGQLIKHLVRFLGYVWSLPHTLFGVLLLLTVYFPKRVRWSEGALDVVVRWHLIPKGMDKTGDGDLDDPEDFVTGGQTHGIIIFYADEYQAQRQRLRCHERIHVLQCMIFGGLLYPLLYGLSSMAAAFSGDDYYRDNHFEVWARAWEGGDVPWPLKD